MAVIGYGNPPVILQFFTVDHHAGGVGVVRILDELHDGCAVAPYKKSAEFSQEVRVDGEG